MPAVYGAAVFGSEFNRAFQGVELAHIMLNAAANALVMAWALRFNDRLDRKLAMVLSRVVLVHGSIAFMILITRQFHSNQVMLMAAGASAILGATAMSLKHRVSRPRAALVGRWDPVIERFQLDCDWIQNPHTNLSAYDVVLTTDIDLSADWAASLTRAMLLGTPVRHLAEYLEENEGLVSIEHFDFDHIPALGLTSYRARKRLMDIALVAVTLPITIPLMLLGGALVLITMGRPIMFLQMRTGLGGVPFRMYKLRTMRNLSDSGEAKTTSHRADPRITPVGRWLRRTRIDELPQLLNVLMGDMSVIGPRPEWTMLSEGYARDLPAYSYRHLVRPGITGWAQVRSGYAADLAETRTKVGYDLFYIKNLSFSLDIQILFRTVWTLLTGKGAR
jgi:lipopolysaccharide/colanic/teichoic acid biosynthesis glycosyltransferase